MLYGKNKLFQDLSGQKFGRLLVLNEHKMVKNQRLWLCQCDCGIQKFFLSGHFKSGKSRSCGCLARELTSNRVKHRMSKDRFYYTYKNIKNRCENKNVPCFKRYGGRGIKCLWKSFEDFRDDMYESYLIAQKSIGIGIFKVQIDRINPHGHYSKENCRWVDSKTQQNNRGNNFLITHDGKSLTASQWSAITGLNQKVIYARIKLRQWTSAQALTTPVK